MQIGQTRTSYFSILSKDHEKLFRRNITRDCTGHAILYNTLKAAILQGIVRNILFMEISKLNQLLATVVLEFAEVKGRVIDSLEAPTWELADIEHADLTTSWCLKAARVFGMSPVAIAQELVGRLAGVTEIARVGEVVAVAPGYINLRWVDPYLLAQVASVHKPRKRQRRTVIVEYSSPNVAKPLGIGHIRSTIIGESLARIHEFVGEKVVRLNHPGDWGTQFGKLIVMINDRWGGTISREKTIQDFVKLYVEFHDRAKVDATLDPRARQETVKLQQGNKTNSKIWKIICKKSYHEFNVMYKRLGVRFDQTRGESAYEKELPAIVKAARAKGIVIESEGALIIPMEGLASPMIVQKSDGAYLYATTDLAALAYRLHQYRPQAIYYVVGSQQVLHFQQLKKAAELLGIASAQHVTHVPFGMLLGADHKKLSTREGSSIELDGVLNEAVKRARTIVEERAQRERWGKSAMKQICEVIGLGAVKYNDLSQHRIHDVVLEWDRMLSLTGNSAPYLQYSVVRINSILAQATVGDNKRLRPHAIEPLERLLLRELQRFPLVVELAARLNEPHRIADILFTLSSTFHRLYEQLPVLHSEPSARAFRLILIRQTAKTITTGLRLLGIEVPKRM